MCMHTCAVGRGCGPIPVHLIPALLERSECAVPEEKHRDEIAGGEFQPPRPHRQGCAVLVECIVREADQPQPEPQQVDDCAG